MLKRIVHIRPLKAGLTFAILQGGMSLILILPMLIAVTFIPAAPNQPAFSQFPFLIMPFLFMVMSFAMGFLGAVAYNLVSKITGGIEVGIEDVVSN